MTQWLAGRTAAIMGSGLLAEAIAQTLQGAGATMAASSGTGGAALHVLINILPPVEGHTLSSLSIYHYDQAFSTTMGQLYDSLRATTARLKASGGAIVNIFQVGDDASNILAQALADGVESLTACFGATFAAPPNAIRVNGVRLGTARSAGDLAAVAQAVLVLASDQTSYMSGMTVPLLGAVRSIAV